MPTLTILFEGLCCFAEPEEGKGAAFARRAILQDMRNHSPAHTSYIEFYLSDFDEAANAIWAADLEKKYDRHNYYYRHVKVNNVRIALANVASSVSSLTIQPSFLERIPALQEVSSSFDSIQDGYLEPKIASGLVAAYFDITGGVLSGGPAEQFRTKFTPEYRWTERHLAQWAQLEVGIDGNAPLLLVHDLATGGVKPLILKPGTTTITIGNQTKNDILGVPPRAGSRGHFAKYYDLGVNVTSRPEPASDELGLGTGCVPGRFK